MLDDKIQSSLLYTKEDGTKDFVHDSYSAFFAAREAFKRLENGSLDFLEFHRLMGFGIEGSGTVASQFSSTFKFFRELVGDRYKPPKLIEILNDKRIQEFGDIADYHGFGPDSKLLVYIQDAHANYEAQKNIASILESLIQNYGVKLVLKEGQSTDANFRHLRENASLAARKRAAERLLKEAYIAGEDYLDITSDYDFTLQGIEDPAIYKKQNVLFWEIDKIKGLAGEYVNKMIVVADTLKPHIYNDDLRALDEKKKDYENESIDLIRYYKYLYNKAEEKELPLYTFPNFRNLVKASELERKIDLVKIHYGNAPDEEMRLYSDYMEATRNLNINELFREEPLLEDFVKDVLTENSDQKNLLKISKALSIMKNLLRIKAVPEEYKYFQENKGYFEPDFWASFLQEKSQELGIDTNIPENSHIIKDNLAKVEEFYGIAAERNKIFFQKINAHMEMEDANLAALVAGGFHRLYLTKLFLDNGYSYIVIGPHVTTPTDDELYCSALKRNT